MISLSSWDDELSACTDVDVGETLLLLGEAMNALLCPNAKRERAKRKLLLPTIIAHVKCKE
jgi:hypothetical protein